MLELETTIGKIIYSEAPISAEPTKDYKYNFLSQLIHREYLTLTDYNVSISSSIILDKTLTIDNQQYQFNTLSLYGLYDLGEITSGDFILSVTLNTNNEYILNISSTDIDKTPADGSSHFYFIPNSKLNNVKIHKKGIIKAKVNKRKSTKEQDYNEELAFSINDEIIKTVETNEATPELDEDNYYRFYIQRKTFWSTESLNYLNITKKYDDCTLLYELANKQCIKNVITYMKNHNIITGYFVYGKIDCDEYGDYYIGIKRP